MFTSFENMDVFFVRKYLFKVSFVNFRLSYKFDISAMDIHSNMYLWKLIDFVHPVDQFRPGVRYHFFLYGCKNEGYQLVRSVIGYIEELGKLNE